MTDQFVAEIRMFGGPFAPAGWAFCNGQTLSIAQNTTLYSLIGTYYGGDGRSTFALPNLQGRAPMQQGQGSGLSPRTLGQVGGEPTVTLTVAQIPMHNHNLLAEGRPSGNANTSPVANVLAPNTTLTPYAASGSTTPMSPQALGLTGGSGAHNNLPPYLALNFIIALTGIYPQRP